MANTNVPSRKIHSRVQRTRGSPLSIHQTSSRQGRIVSQAQTFWTRWVDDAFPDLNSRSYFLPPVYVNRVHVTREATLSQDVLVLRSAPSHPGQMKQPTATASSSCQVSSLKPVFESDIRDDSAMQRVFMCLQKLGDSRSEVMVGISQLQFGQYLGEPCYAAAAAQLPRPSNLPPKLEKGDFDVLLIHQQYGFVVCEVKAFGDKIQQLNMPQPDVDNVIRKKLKQSVSQLDKAEAVLSHLVSDISPSLRITKTIAVPNLTACQVQQAILSDTKLTQDLCRCLGTTDPAAITGLCLCSDQLSDPKTPWDVSSDVLVELENWWKRRVAGAGPDSHMTPVLYKTLIARFCGPATTVTVPCTSPPRLCVKTLGQAVFLTGQCYTAQITLFPEQVDLLNNAPQRLFIAGPPGTGKTVMLLLVGTEWLRRRIQVNIVCTGRWSRVACRMVHHLLLHTINTQQVAVPLPGLLKLRQYDFSDGKDVEKAVSDLSQMATEGSLYVIADEVASEQSSDYYFKEFCEKLLARVSNLHLWAATCYHGNAPAGWQTESLTRPLRSPPVIVREIEQDWAITRSKEVQAYSERGVPDHTDGPPVTQLTHRGQDHSGHLIGECITCGRDVASFLNSLHIGAQLMAKTSATGVPTSGSTPPSTLQWRDVLLLHSSGVGDKSAVVMAMRNAGIPVQVMKEADHEDVAIARSDVVWVADAKLIRGVERKVVVCLQTNLADLNVRLHAMSRCTSQLVIFSTDRPLDTGLDPQADTQAQDFADFL